MYKTNKTIPETDATFYIDEDNSFDLTGESSGIYYYECVNGTKYIHKGKVILIK
jgi:hypothetical protein